MFQYGWVVCMLYKDTLLQLCMLWVIWNMGETSEMPTRLVDARRE
jgi:hypothetical protein